MYMYKHMYVLKIIYTEIYQFEVVFIIHGIINSLARPTTKQRELDPHE